MNSVGVRNCNACKEEPELRTLKPIFATEAFPLLKRSCQGGLTTVSFEPEFVYHMAHHGLLL